MRKSYFLKSGIVSLFLLSFEIGIVFPQAITVTGSVTSKEATPISGVSIVVQETTQSTITDAEGKYSIEVPGPEAILVFSTAGFNSQTITVHNRSVIDVILLSELYTERVVTAYANQGKLDLTGSVGIVRPEELVRMPGGNVTQQLQGFVPGVTVTQDSRPGHEAKVRIRGFGSFYENDPLYIVDGIPVTDINSLNPTDIESLAVLKDAGAASVYGTRAANGVIIITTKKGQQGMKVNYNMYYGTQRPGPGPDFLLNSEEYMDLQQLVYDNDGTTDTHPVYGQSGNLNLPSWAADTKWWDEIMRNAPIMNHDLSLSGGNQTSSYYASIGYFDQEGTVIYNWYKRYSARFNSEFRIRDRVTIGQNANAIHQSDNEIDANGGENTAMMGVYRSQSIIPVKWNSGTFTGLSHTFEDGDWGGTGIIQRLGDRRNYVADRTRNKDDRWEDTRLMGNIFLDVKILEGLNFRTSFGGSVSNWYITDWTGETYENLNNTSPSTYAEYSGYSRNWTWTNTITLSRQFGNHNILAIGGYEAVKEGIGRDLGAQRANYYSDKYLYRTLSNGAELTAGNSFFYTPRTMISQFLRADYNFSSRYYLSGTVRRDGASVFGEDTRYGVFPSVSAGWRINEESFFAGIGFISDLKIRGGYGTMGNWLPLSVTNQFNIYDNGPSMSYYDISGTGYSSEQGCYLIKIGNPDNKWETNVTINVGFDAMIFEKQLELHLDWYRRENKDLLYYSESLAYYQSVILSSYVNQAEMKNDGIDIQMVYRKNWSDFSIEAGMQFTTYHNEIVKITDSIQYFDAGVSTTGSSNKSTRNMTGHALGEFYSYHVTGLFLDAAEVASAPIQVGAEPGFFRYEDVNNDTIIDPDDMTFIGNPNPKFTCGLNLVLRYKDFDMAAFIYGVYGNEIFNYNRWWLDFWPSFQGQKSTDLLYESWTSNNTDAKVPRASGESNFSTNAVLNSYYIEDGSYLRLRSLQIGYTLPGSFMNNVFSSARIYVQGVNLFTVTKYTGMDPELASFDDTFFGVDAGNLPFPRQFLVGVNISF